MSGNVPVLLKSTSYLLAILLTSHSFAASTITPEKPGGELTPLDQNIPKKKPGQPNFILPDVPPADDGQLSEQIKVFVRHIELIGNTIFSDQELEKITASYEGREITTDELQALRIKLTQHYLGHGYINSGAIIPDQEVNSGVLAIQIIEGHLKEVSIKGIKHLKESYVKNRLILNKDEPLNINQLQEKILLLHQDRLIDRIDANLSPGAMPGEAVLDVNFEESRPYDLGFSFNNWRSPSVGELRGEVWGIHHNLTGYGDALSLQYGLTEGLDDYSIDYSVPLNADDTSFRIAYTESDTEVIEEPFNLIDIASETESFELGLSHPFMRSPYGHLTGSIILNRRTSESFLLGIPFSFSPGTVNGKSTVSVVRFGVDWVKRSDDSVLAILSRVNVGLDTFGSTINSGDIPDSEFLSFLNQFQWVQRLPIYNAQLIFRNDLQLATEALLSLEKFGIGGANSVRGYRENELIKDYGVVSSVEVRVPVAQLPFPWEWTQQLSDETLQVAAFSDIGWGEDFDNPTEERKLIHSLGLGLRWAPNPHISGQFYWAQALKNIPSGVESSLQEKGVHFRLDLRY